MDSEDSSASVESDAYDVYISYSRADAAWATRVARDLSERGLRTFSGLDVSAGDRWAEELNRVLDTVGTVVVLWSRAAQGSEGISARSPASRRWLRTRPDGASSR